MIGWSRFLLLLCIAAAGSAAAQDLITHVSGRRTTSLAGPWRTIIDPYETGAYNYRREAYDSQPQPSMSAFYANHKARDSSELIEYDFDASPTLDVPGDWNSQRESLRYYEGTVWYRQTFDFATPTDGRRLFVHFGAVNQRADVYLNGVKLGRHDGGFTPFQFEITRVVRPRGNFLVVKVDNTRRPDAVPTLNTDWWNYGGITREVVLIDEPAVFVRDFTLQLKRGTEDIVAGYVQLDGASEPQRVGVALPGLGTRHESVTDANGRATFEFRVPGLVRWSPESPTLHTATVTTAHQSLEEQIGFRTIETRGADILLNGRPIFLRGISLHEENPLAGRRAHSADDARLLLGWARELGANFVRLAHYPHNENMVRMADRMGLLVWAEIPVYWTVDFTNPATLANATRQLGEMIARDRNRASVIIWSVANETPPGDARNRFLRQLIAQARRLDDSRLISAALETRNENGVTVVDDRIGSELDIVAFNQYRGWYGGTLHDAPDARWDIRFDKPVVISEFGGDARQGLHGSRDERWTEEYQAYLYEQNLAMIARMPNVRGLSPWILADFRSPRRVLPGIQDGYNRKGLISSDGIRKKAFGILQRHYAALAADAASR